MNSLNLKLFRCGQNNFIEDNRNQIDAEEPKQPDLRLEHLVGQIHFSSTNIGIPTTGSLMVGNTKRRYCGICPSGTQELC